MGKPVIKSRGTDGKKYVTMQVEEWRGMQETLYLLSNPDNAKILLASIAEMNKGRGIERELVNVEAKA